MSSELAERISHSLHCHLHIDKAHIILRRIRNLTTATSSAAQARQAWYTLDFLSGWRTEITPCGDSVRPLLDLTMDGHRTQLDRNDYRLGKIRFFRNGRPLPDRCGIYFTYKAYIKAMNIRERYL